MDSEDICESTPVLSAGPGEFLMPEQEDIKFVLDFFADITGDDNQFKFLLVTMAAAIEGCNRFNEFVLMCGACKSRHQTEIHS
eukprot:SAG22_NODE_2643_length_2341_cov_6.214541_2_plen_83_part_00